MKKTFILFSILTLFMAAGSQAYNEWGLMGSYWSSDDFDHSAGATARLSMSLQSEEYLELRISSFDDFSYRKANADLELGVIPVEAGLSLPWRISERSELFGGAGVGYYILDLDSRGAGNFQADDEIGFYLNGGWRWTLFETGPEHNSASTMLYAECIYRYARADISRPEFEDTGNEIVQELSLDGFGASLGLMVRW